jgi:MFS family permease
MTRVLPIIILSQFFCTSLWFAGNAILPDILLSYHLEPDFLGHLTSAVQFGFITGTLVFALFTISDRFSPSLVFLASSLLAALFNLGVSIDGAGAPGLLAFRFFTGFFLAGIYPVGMKIASDYFQKGLGLSLGFLVGALVLGTAFPHLLKNFTTHLPWKYVIYATSFLSAAGGLLMWLLVPDGPFRKAGQKLNLSAFAKGFKDKNLRSAALGYFGHMWELYTFWAFVPVMLASFNNLHPESSLNVSLLSFLIIALGGVACVAGGYLSKFYGTKNIAAIALGLSCLCCLSSPVFLFGDSVIAFLIFLFFWGLAVIADSPLFSTLVAQNAPEESRGTSLTIVNCIGFSITIFSIQLTNLILTNFNSHFTYLLLALGPLLGLIALFGNNVKSRPAKI